MALKKMFQKEEAKELLRDLSSDLTKEKVKKLVIFFLALCLVGCLLLGGMNLLVCATASQRFLAEGQEIEKVDCILVLGCGIKKDGTPSDMLADRVDTAIALYQAGVSDKILMSGDHGQNGYDEVSAMKIYAMQKGVPSEAVFMDHAGFSTYESMVRAKEIFGVTSCVVVTQEYHLYRGVYNAQMQGIEAYGVAADKRSYTQAFQRITREILARGKDCIYSLVKPAPTYLGDFVGLDGSGDKTNDETFEEKWEAAR